METQIIELEKKYWQGMENHDYETVKNLTHFPCIIAGKNGVQSVDEANFKKMFESGDGDKIKVLNFSDVETQLIVENAAIIAYQIELGIVDDKQKAPMKCACTSTWTIENNNWVCVLHTEVELSKQ
ncbi:nuclear transport factor 2 family protein [Flavobacterium sp. CF136]|uniref:nuclear transport factor 2 family protein n=1 Tax=Flavobacterium sp. (strain CF136) TaxID=1144313 RepID=UPI0002719F24|nr:nuclear transport factor 2 family protein [Flavobacterium sp. CF136]EJL65606.1 protein kinase II-like association domain protein-containing protein [Flavobacterium sp. CF136]